MKKITIYILTLSLLLVLFISTEAFAAKKACPQCGRLAMTETLKEIWVYKWNASSHYYNKTVHQTCSKCTYDKDVVTIHLSGSHSKSSNYTVGSYLDSVNSLYHHTVYMKFYDCTYEKYNCDHRFPGETWYGPNVKHSFKPTQEYQNGKLVTVIKCACGAKP